MSTTIDNNKEQLLLVVYENLLAANLLGLHPNGVMSKFFISVERQLEDFENEYPEIVSEYYSKHRP